MNAVQLQNDILKLVRNAEDFDLLKSIKILRSQEDGEYVLSDIEKQFLAESEGD